jgi:hypothetical protein
MHHIDFTDETDVDWFLAQDSVSGMVKSLYVEGERVYFRISFPREAADTLREWLRRTQDGHGSQTAEQPDTSPATREAEARVDASDSAPSSATETARRSAN